MYIIRTVFGRSVSYASISKRIYIAHYTYTLPRRYKIANMTPIQGPVPKININIHLQNI